MELHVKDEKDLNVFTIFSWLQTVMKTNGIHILSQPNILFYMSSEIHSFKKVSYNNFF